MNGGELLLSIVRAVHIGAAMLAVAFPFFVVIPWRPEADEVKAQGRFCRKMYRILAMVWIVELLTGAAWLILISAAINDESSWREVRWDDVVAVLTQTQFGTLWIIRAILALMLGVCITLGLVRSASLKSLNPLVLVLAGALAGSLAWAGHAGSTLRWPAFHLMVDIAHLLAAAIWPLGLVPFALFLAQPKSKALLRPGEINVVRRFSQTSFAAVLVLVASGIINSWLMLPSWSALADSIYGRLLLGKVSLVVIMIALGALNRYRFVPALEAENPARLFRSIAVETGLAVAVLGIVGVMGSTAPPS